MLGLTPEELARQPFFLDHRLRSGTRRTFLPRDYKLRRLVQVGYRVDESGRTSRVELKLPLRLLAHPCLGEACAVLLRAFLGPSLAGRCEEGRWSEKVDQDVEGGRLSVFTHDELLCCRLARAAERICPRCQRENEADARYCSGCGKRLEAGGFWGWLAR